MSSSYYYKAARINEFLESGNNDVTTNFKELDASDMSSKFGKYSNDIENANSKALNVYTDLGYNYWNGSSYVNIATISKPKSNDFEYRAGLITIPVPGWCTKIYFILIGGGGGGESMGTSSNSGYPGGGGEFVYGCVTKPANTIYCNVGVGGDLDENGGNTYLFYNNGGFDISMAKAFGGLSEYKDAPGDGGSGGYVNNGISNSVLIRRGCYGSNTRSSAANGMKYVDDANFNDVEAGTTLSGFNKKNVLHYNLQNATYGYGGEGEDDNYYANPGNNGFARIYFSP